MTQITIQEYGNHESISVKGKSDKDVVKFFQKLNLKLKSLGLPKDPFQLSNDNGVKIRAQGITGQIRVGNIDLMIIPKYLAKEKKEEWSKSLIKMLDISQSSKWHSRYHITRGSQGPLNLIDLIASYFVESLTEAIERGQPIGYVEKQLVSPYFRGRFDIKREAIIMTTKPYLVAIKVSTMTNDIPLTRLLKWACMFLQQKVIKPEIRQHLSHLTENFANVSNILPSLGTLERIRLGGPQLQYQKPFTIALWLAKQSGQIQYPKFAEVPGIVLRSDKVFENFVSGLLRRISMSKNWTHYKQKSALLATNSKNDTMNTRPDDLIYIDRNISLVLDSKYKGESESEKVDRQGADVYQLITSCRVAQCKRGVLVYPTYPEAELVEWKISSDGIPEKFFTIGINPALLSEKNGLTKIISSLEKNILTAISG